MEWVPSWDFFESAGERWAIEETDDGSYVVVDVKYRRVMARDLPRGVAVSYCLELACKHHFEH